MSLRTPQPPKNTNNKELHKSLTEICNYIKISTSSGILHTPKSQVEIDSMLGDITTNPKLKKYIGRTVTNTTTSKPNSIYLDGTTIKAREY